MVFFTLVGDFSQALAEEDNGMKFPYVDPFLSAVDKKLYYIIRAAKARYKKE